MKCPLAVPCCACALSLAPMAAAAAPFRVQVENPVTESVLQRVLPGAARRLATPACAQVLSDFKDAQGRTLRQNLDALGQTPDGYLALIVFAEGQARAACRKASVLAATRPHSRVVFVCPHFARKRARSDENREAIVIHEALHTLGLEENPPTTHEITDRVMARCGNQEIEPARRVRPLR